MNISISSRPNLTFQPERAYAQHLDDLDNLNRFREEFTLTDPDLLYMDGNSLGRLPKRTSAVLQNGVEEQWGNRLIRSWGEGWFEAPRRVGDKIAQLVGAGTGEIVVGDSTSINLYKLIQAALQLRSDRARIITDSLNFPSDVYILQGCVQASQGRHRLEIIQADEDNFADYSQSIIAAIDRETALVVLSQVAFKSGYMYDTAAITQKAHAIGALVLWDLSHSAGAVPLRLDKWGVDFAVGCTYKYLNGGPGAPAFLFVNKAIQNEAISPVWGWFGEDRPFAFDLDYHPAPGITRFLCGTPPMLSMLGIESGVDLLLEAGIENLREKSLAQTDYLIQLFDRFLAPLGFTLGTPREADLRGSHVSIRHTEGYRINQALIEEMQVIPDFREPDNIRLGIAPIYTRFVDIWDTVERIARVVIEQRYRKYSTERADVT